MYVYILWVWELTWNNEIYEIFLYWHLCVKISMCEYEYVDTKVGTLCGCKLVPNTNTNLFRDIKNHQWFTQKLHYNSKTFSLVILSKYLFVHDFVRLTYGFIHILTNYIVLGAHLLSLWRSNQCLHSWPREMVTLSSDSIDYCKSSNKSLMNSK